MRRNDRECRDPIIIEEIMKKGEVLRIALVDDGVPYLVPVNFAYQNNVIYIHCALDGRKLDIIRKNNYVCFQTDIDVELDIIKIIPTTYYKSVIGYGNALIVEDKEEMTKALDLIMIKYGREPVREELSCLNRIMVIKIEIEKLECKINNKQ